MLALFVIILLLAPANCLADELSFSELEVSIGLEGISSIQKRGATFYDSYQVFPLLAIKLFNPQLQIVGSSLYAHLKLTDNLRVFSILNPQISNQPLYETGGKEPNEEKTAAEWDHMLEYKQGKNLVSLLVSKGFKGHFGSHLELRYRYNLVDFILKSFSAQASAEFKLGLGSALHNQFYYGDNANESGLNYYSLGIVLTGEPRVDRLFPLIEGHYNRILGDNRQGVDVKSKRQNFYFLFILAKNLI